MKILKFKKLKKGKYKVTFDTNELILYENVIVNNNLLLKKDISLRLLEKLIEENKYYEIYDMSLSLIETKMRTEKELINNLEKKGFDITYINETIERLKKEGYLNQEKYIEAFINDRVNLSSDGPYKIKRSLLDKELSETLIDNYLETIDNDKWKEKLNKIINKRLNLMKNKSISSIKNKLKIDLYNLGYQTELIEECLSSLQKNDTIALEKEFNKSLIKYSKKYNGALLYNQIKSSLYRKGFNIEEINDIINKYENL